MNDREQAIVNTLANAHAIARDRDLPLAQVPLEVVLSVAERTKTLHRAWRKLVQLCKDQYPDVYMAGLRFSVSLDYSQCVYIPEDRSVLDRAEPHYRFTCVPGIDVRDKETAAADPYLLDPYVEVYRFTAGRWQSLNVRYGCTPKHLALACVKPSERFDRIYLNERESTLQEVLEYAAMMERRAQPHNKRSHGASGHCDECGTHAAVRYAAVAENERGERNTRQLCAVCWQGSPDPFDDPEGCEP